MTDRTLIYHYPLCPFCRLVRLAFYEKGILHSLLTEIPWERRPAFLEKNPLGTVPLIVEPDDYYLSGATTICAYLNEIRPLPDLIGKLSQLAKTFAPSDSIESGRVMAVKETHR